jgi:hypothetical protein
MKQKKGTLGHPPRNAAPRRSASLAAGLAAAACALGTQSASAEPALQDYHYFRALSIDLQGRVPSRAELAAFEKPGFDLDGWIDDHLDSPLYAERVSRIYLDLLRLELNTTFVYRPSLAVLRRALINGPGGKPMYVYYRFGERRQRPDTDGVFCLTFKESGLKTGPNGTQFGADGKPVTPGMPPAVVVDQTTLDKYTKVVKPWWLYRDYASANPKDLYTPDWQKDQPSYLPSDAMINDVDGTPATQIRICNEEADSNKDGTGTVYTTGLTTPYKSGDPIPYDRLVPLPRDSKYATDNTGKTIPCDTQTAHGYTLGCGCGAGLERCIPGTSDSLDPASFNQPFEAPLGREMPFATNTQAESGYSRQAWAVEASAFISDIFANDRDFRDMLLSKATVVNGPAAQFYRFFAGGSCCNDTVSYGYTYPTQLLDPTKLPPLLPHETNKYVRIEDRGPLASGILTMPIFLMKYGTRRARAHILYNAFLCKDFVSANSSLMPSTEPDLTKRSGCKDCHATLEPMSAYFARIRENDWVYLPKEQFPVQNPACKSNKGTIPSFCKNYYDPAFTTDTSATLRGAYSSADNADAGPGALAEQLTKSPDFASCVVKNVASSFLGRPLDVDDEPLEEALTKTFVDGGYRVRAVVRAMLKSDQYRLGNDRLNAEGQ